MPFTFLDRIEPFTSLHKLTKDSIKDIKQPVSTSFGSIILSEEDIKVKSCFIELLNNTNVCHELVPEFFFFTVFLSKPKTTMELKNNRFQLPKWAKSLIDFVYKMRKALENDYFSQNLPDWIDLIWASNSLERRKLDSFSNFDPRLLQQRFDD